ncbi:MAG: hypothetical protein Q9222_005006 [Ikaeria aurantiellina]
MVGPPPYKSRKNAVIYLLSVLVEAKVDRRRVYVRRSEEVMVLTVHDPEKALLNLPNPLVVTDEIHVSHHGSLETVTLTAGVHRQTWISGYPLFVDVKVRNQGNKMVKKVELQLERLTFVYAHAAPSEEAGLGDTLRLPDRCDKELILKAACLGWQVPGQTHELRTCSLLVPPGLVSVDAGKRLSPNPQTLDAQLSSRSLSRYDSDVQDIPDMAGRKQVRNTIDIPPNSIAQVAVTIEHKHRNRLPSTPDAEYSYRPGQAFLAARRQSFEQVTRDTIPQRELDNIAEALGDPSQRPRRRASTTHIITDPTGNPRMSYRNSRFLEGTDSFRQPPQNPPPAIPTVPGTNLGQQSRPSIPRRRNHHTSLEEQASRQRLLSNEAIINGHRRYQSSLGDGGRYRGPRLQRSTSGLKFSSSSEDDDDGDGEEDLEVGNTTVADALKERRARLRKRSRCQSRLPLRKEAL